MSAATHIPRRGERGAATSPLIRTILFWAAMIFLALLLWRMSSQPASHPAPPINSSEFQSQMETKNVRSAHLTVYRSRALIVAEKRDSGEKFQAYVSNDQVPAIIRELEENGVDVWIQGGQEPESSLLSFLLDGLPFFLLLVVFIIMMRRQKYNQSADSGQPL